ncbi:hypothetical protein AAFF_G00092580 [Aldrovandia affinis]|uniref:Uncharacterized protein n=1 Tax=Aldrovandia affinis TaxID=143900 RepID=A0AAD7WXW1_9TELE|nr:hypothetical protein AAFF_G00092580 [Aldrovandia affinis]
MGPGNVQLLEPVTCGIALWADPRDVRLAWPRGGVVFAARLCRFLRARRSPGRGRREHGAPRQPTDEARGTMIVPLVLKLLNEPLLSAHLSAAHMPCEPGLPNCCRWDRNDPRLTTEGREPHVAPLTS